MWFDDEDIRTLDDLNDAFDCVCEIADIYTMPDVKIAFNKKKAEILERLNQKKNPYS
jgi:hypothetical protein